MRCKDMLSFFISKVNCGFFSIKIKIIFQTLSLSININEFTSLVTKNYVFSHYYIISKYICNMKIKIINKSHHPLPQYATPQSAGLDLRAYLSAPITLKPLERMLVSTGLSLELPDGYEAQIRPRSGLAAKYGITVLNSPGTIDADYRGEIKVILINLSHEDFVINDGERICQMVIAPYTQVELINVEELSDTERGDGGFGHTGKQ